MQLSPSMWIGQNHIPEPVEDRALTDQLRLIGSECGLRVIVTKNMYFGSTFLWSIWTRTQFLQYVSQEHFNSNFPVVFLPYLSAKSLQFVPPDQYVPYPHPSSHKFSRS